MRTLDDILTEARAPVAFEFLSIDVEGHELEVLGGFDLARWRPRLILLEDHVGDLAKHRYLENAGYRLIRRCENNGWYVPRDAAICGRSARALGDRAQVLSRPAVPHRAQCIARGAPADQGLADCSPLLVAGRLSAWPESRLDLGYGRRNGSLGGGAQLCISS